MGFVVQSSPACWSEVYVSVQVVSQHALSTGGLDISVAWSVPVVERFVSIFVFALAFSGWPTETRIGFSVLLFDSPSNGPGKDYVSLCLPPVRVLCFLAIVGRRVAANTMCSLVVHGYVVVDDVQKVSVLNSHFSSVGDG